MFDATALQCESDGDATIWIITQPGNPAHPAISRGQILTANSQTCIVRDGYFSGNEVAFSAWIASLKRYDEQVVKEFQRAKPAT